MIRSSIILILMALMLVSCGDRGDKSLSTDLVKNPKSAQSQSDKTAVIEFQKTEYDFGKILQGEVVAYTFHFVNSGNAPLIITSIDKSCGCTASDFPREPIAPGEGGDVKITYDSKGAFGFQSKTLVVNANTMPARTTLRVKAEVRTPDEI